MLEEANDETLALIKKLNYMKCDEEFKAILSSVSPKVVDQTNFEGECKGNLLHHAISSCKKEHVVALLQHGVDPKVPKPSPHGDVPPLQLAIWADCMDIWNILAEHLELSDEDKLNQLYIMIQARFNESDQVFKTFNNLLSSLPVELVSTSCVQGKLRKERGGTLLQIAAECGSNEAVRLLLEKGVDPKAISEKDDVAPIKTALNRIGGISFNTEIFDMLRKATGEDVSDDMKLELLARCLDQELGEESDKKRAKEIFCEVLPSLSPELVSVTAVMFPNQKSWGLLQYAVNEGKTDFIRILLEHGVDPTVQFDSAHRKFSALELAAMDDCCDATDKLGLLAEFIEIPAEIKEVMEMGTDGDDEKEARMRKLASLLKIDMD